MIIYRKKYLGLFMLAPTAPCAPAVRALFPAALSGVMALVLSTFEVVGTDRNLMEHPYPFQVFCLVLGFLLVFRTNFAYNRYIQGVQHVSQMTSKWGDAILQLISFDSMMKESSQGEREAFRLEAVHLMSLLHAVALLKLRADPDLGNLHEYDPDSGTTSQGFPNPWAGPLIRAIGVNPEQPPSCASTLHLTDSFSIQQSYTMNPLHVIGGVRPFEGEALESVDDKAFLVMQWIIDLLVLQGKFKYLEAEGPIVSRVYQFLSDGTLGYNAARKLTEIPFPFSWAQITLSLLLIFTFSCPVLMAAWIENPWFAAVWTAIAVWVFVTINEVNRDMEDPFLGLMPHENLPLPVLQADFNNRLWSLQAQKRNNRLTVINAHIGTSARSAHRERESQEKLLVSNSNAEAHSSGAPSSFESKTFPRPSADGTQNETVGDRAAAMTSNGAVAEDQKQMRAIVFPGWSGP